MRRGPPGPGPKGRRAKRPKPVASEPGKGRSGDRRSVARALHLCNAKEKTAKQQGFGLRESGIRCSEGGI